MAVYPFYVESNADSRRSPIAGGCRSKDGQQLTTIYQRERGAIITAFEIVQRSHIDPETGERILTCTVFDRHRKVVAEEKTIY